MNPIEILKDVGDKPFTIEGYKRSDGSVVTLRLRMLPPDGYRKLLEESLEHVNRHTDDLTGIFGQEAVESVRSSLSKSLAPAEEKTDQPKRVSKETITSVSPNLALLDDDPDKVILFRTQTLESTTLVEPSKMVKSRDETSANKKKLNHALPVGSFCFRLNLYKGNYERILV